MTEREFIGKKVAEIRNDKGYSIRELANLCGVNYSNIGKIERGAYNVSIDILSRISNALGCEITLEKRTELKIFIINNQDRDDVLGDLCHDLLRDGEFLELKTEEEQREHIISVGNWHSHIQDSVIQLFKEYAGEDIHFDE